MVVNRQPIFEKSPTSKFFMRPRPIEALLFFGYIFNALRVFGSLIMALDVIPNQIFRSFIYEFPWQIGFASFACYMYGIAYTISNSSKVIRSKWVKSDLKIDAFCITLICLPFITNNICSIGSGVYASRGDFVTADKFTKCLYYCWAIYCFALATMILSAGLRLLNILSQHVGNEQNLSHSTQKIRHGMFKIKVIMTISTISLYIFAFIKLMYAIMRPRILANTSLNLVFALIWTFDATVASSLNLGAIVINPTALNPINLSSDYSSTSRIEKSKFIASASLASTEFDHVKTRPYMNQFEQISDHNEENFQMNIRHY